jgi:hypothetical protein
MSQDHQSMKENETGTNYLSVVAAAKRTGRIPGTIRTDDAVTARANRTVAIYANKRVVTYVS